MDKNEIQLYIKKHLYKAKLNVEASEKRTNLFLKTLDDNDLFDILKDLDSLSR